MTYYIKVPATTANLGPAFDAGGLALQLYNEFKVETIEKGIEIIDCDDIPLEENLIYTTLRHVFERYGESERGIKVIPHRIEIPMSRGLGSSAACIAAGIMIANRALGDILSVQDMICIGTEIEGHPDNIVPALVGGMTVSICHGQEVLYTKVKIPEDLRFAVMIPDFTVATAEARKVLPEQYSKEDCIFNISRVAMLMAAMNNGEIEKLRPAMEDRIHQPYRQQLIPGMKEIFQQAQRLGSRAEVISGSGSTLMAIVERKNVFFEREMEAFLKNLECNWRLLILEYDNEGIKVY